MRSPRTNLAMQMSSPPWGPPSRNSRSGSSNGRVATSSSPSTPTAGQGATVRSLEMLPGALDQELTPIGAERDANRPRAETMIIWQRRFKSQISIVRLPEGKDPDELIRRDPGSWSTVVASAQPFLDFYIDAALSAVGRADAPAKAAAVRRLIPLLEAAGDQVVQAHYAGIIARKLQLPESSVLRELRRSAVRSTASRS